MKQKLFLLTFLTATLVCSFNATYAQRRSAAKNAKKTSSSTKTGKRTSSAKKSSNNSSNSDSKLMSNIFWGSLINGGLLPGSLYYFDESIGIDPNGENIIGKSVDNKVSVNGYANALFFGYNARYILKELDAEKSICLDASPSLGLTITSKGLGSLEVPVLISYNTGTAATSNSKQDNGFGIGLGVHLVKLGLIQGFSLEESNTRQTIARTLYVQPAATLTYRYFNDNDNAREWSLKLGYSSHGIYDPESRIGEVKNSAFANSGRNFTESQIKTGGYSTSALMVRLSLGYYLGY